MTVPTLGPVTSISLPADGGSYTQQSLTMPTVPAGSIVLVLVVGNSIDTFPSVAGLSLLSGQHPISQAVPAVTSITCSGGLTFAKRSGPAQLYHVPLFNPVITPTPNGTVSAELWWAAAPTAHTAMRVTAQFSNAFDVYSGGLSLFAVAVSGCASLAWPWDTTPGLPASATGAAPLTLRLNTAARSALTVADGTQSGQTIILADALPGTAGAAMALAAVVDPAPASRPGTQPIPWQVSSAVTIAPQLGAGFFVADFPAALPATPGAPSSDPTTVYLSWSDDRGHTFGNPVGLSLGGVGQYLTAMQWRRLGLGRDRVFQLEWSGTADTALAGAWIVAEPAQPEGGRWSRDCRVRCCNFAMATGRPMPAAACKRWSRARRRRP